MTSDFENPVAPCPIAAKPSTEQIVGIVGLGYVGLPLALEFGREMKAIGFDTSTEKVALYSKHEDPTGQASATEFKAATHLSLTDDATALQGADFIIIAVPTPVDEARLPDFEPIVRACRSVGPQLKHGAVVIFESTVFPGATEEIAVPELEKSSGKRWKRDFFVGYSPERINPGDKEHTLRTITKVVAADTPRTLDRVAELYSRIVDAGVYRASSIRVAEAAKVIENTQRDLNIALMNELSLIFHRMGIDTHDVLDAASTKWNFLRFTPGLVGGHCIGVDPYYLTHAAEKVGHHPEVILAGRRINDSMGKYIAEQTVKCMVTRGSRVNGARVNVLGLAFKENCPDLRNSKVVDVIRELESYGAIVSVYDPRVSRNDAYAEYGIELCSWEQLPVADAIVLAVAHREFLAEPLSRITGKVAANGCVIDVKAVLDRRALESTGLRVWRL